MLVNKLIADVEARAGVTKVFVMILGASLITNMMLAGTLLTMDKTVRTVLVPPEISKSFWIDGHTISQGYLEEMGSWVISQYASVTPSTIDYQQAQLLKYVHPSIYGDLSVRFKMGANRLKRENMSKVFFPREIRMSEKGKSVALIGLLQTWIGDKKLPDEQKAYLVTFDYDGSRTFIKELRETSAGRPFDPASAPAAPEPEPTQTGAATAPPEPEGSMPATPQPVQPEPTAVPSAGALPPAPQPNSPATREALQTGAAPSNPNIK